MNRLRDPLIIAGMIIAAIAFAVFAGRMAGWMLARGQVAKTEARLEAGRSDAALQSAQDAVNSIAGAAASEAAGDAITLENSREILSAQGAAAPVDPAVAAAGLRGLCRRAAYRDSSQCLQFAPAR